jgi:enoyl-CoA hydratase/carnithine racemase
LSNYDNDKSIGAIIITGSEKAFAGASISNQPYLNPIQTPVQFTILS